MSFRRDAAATDAEATARLSNQRPRRARYPFTVTSVLFRNGYHGDTPKGDSKIAAALRSATQPKELIMAMQLCEDSSLSRACRSNGGNDHSSGRTQEVGSSYETAERTEARCCANRGGHTPPNISRPREL